MDHIHILTRMSSEYILILYKLLRRSDAQSVPDTYKNGSVFVGDRNMFLTHEENEFIEDFLGKNLDKIKEAMGIRHIHIYDG